MSEIDIAFRGVSKTYGDVLAVDSVDLEIPHGAFVSLLGPSGCGKTTSLRIMAGFEQPTEGDVEISGRSVVGVPAYRRPVNMVFQNYALFPHLNVFDNVAFGLRQQSPRPQRSQIERQVDRALELVRLSGYAARRIWELSGGQQQRVALARALINRPKVLLLDEPLAALDRKLRRDMQIELQNLQNGLGITFVLVTHDQEEALSMSDLVCIMREGRIMQSGSPQSLYDEPVNRYVADFVGRSNFFAGEVIKRDGDRIELKTADDRLMTGRLSRGSSGILRGDPAALMIRPELISISAKSANDDRAEGSDVRARIKNRIFLGEHTEYLVEAPGLGEILVLTPKKEEAGGGGFLPGDSVVVGWTESAALVLADN
jgi:spermidine/putrescine transport system ATP-binding protein